MSKSDNEIKNIEVINDELNLGREIIADNDNTFGKLGKKSKEPLSKATVSFEFQRIKTTGLLDPSELPVSDSKSYGLMPEDSSRLDSNAQNNISNSTETTAEDIETVEKVKVIENLEDVESAEDVEIVESVEDTEKANVFSEIVEDLKEAQNRLRISGRARDLRQAVKAKIAATDVKSDDEMIEGIDNETSDPDKLLEEIFDEPNKNVLGDINDESLVKPNPTVEDNDNMPNKKSAAKTANKSGKKTVNAKKPKAVNATKKAAAGAQGAKKAVAGAATAGAAKAASDKKKSEPKQKPKKVRKQRNKVWAVVRGFLIICVTLGIIGCVAGGGYAAYVISQADTIHPDRIYEALDVSSHIYDQDGNLVDEIYYTENRQLVTYDQLPDNLKNAFIAIEDKTFWTHRGFNFRRIIGAILERFRGGRISGTSTITQQLARNVFLPEEKEERSIKRKIIEMYYAYEIEQELSKEEILTAYLNTIYLGYGCYGVDTAARTYFGTTVEKLTLEQCASLAALPQAPNSYALLTNEEGENTTEISEGLYANDTSQERRNLVLTLMEEQGYITEDERVAATKPIEEFISPGKSSSNSKSAFKDYLIETVISDLMTTYDLSEEQASKMLYTKGLKIYSTLASKTQAIITKEFANDSNFPSAADGADVEAAMVIVEVGTGEIKAMVGSRNASGEMLFNRATNARQPGSSIKPLSVYAAALQKSYELEKEGKTWNLKDFDYDIQGTLGWGKYITAASIVADQKVTINGKAWPQNVTRSYSGIQTFRTALQKSINTCAVKILSQVGVDYSMEMVKNFGITTAIDDTSLGTNDLNYAALGLGAMSEGVTPLEMACAYAAFPNGGVRNTPICYTRVEDREGNVILEGKSESIKVMDEGVAWIMTDILKSVVSKGIAGSAAVSGVSVGGKTGTTDDRYDIWFDGFTPQLSAALWIGTDENKRMDSGSEAAARLWSKIMSQLQRAKQGEYKSMPDNVVKKNGEYFTEGTEKGLSSGSYSGVTSDGKYIPSEIDRINGWTKADQEKADKKLEEEAKKKAEEAAKKAEEAAKKAEDDEDD